MKLFSLLAILALSVSFVFSQSEFENAYANNKLIPSGLLEAVAWTNTHMNHLKNSPESCSGIPQPYGIMGLHDNGKGYFIENGRRIAELSGIEVQAQKASARDQIMAYAMAFNRLLTEKSEGESDVATVQRIREVLSELSEIPDSGIVNSYAKDAQIYAILTFMNSEIEARKYGFSSHHYNLTTVFGEANYKVLSSSRITITEEGIQSENNAIYTAIQNKSTEYGPAIWNPAAACNISSRSGTAISAITIHTIQGTYAGAISWAQNCASSVSYHYVIRSSDGQVTQMVLEADKAWHVGSENPYTIGYEHEGYVDNASWYTEEMYNSSADLSRDVVNSGYGIPPLRTFYGDATVGTNTLGACTKIKGHQHYPNQTHVDPGINWDWEKYYRLINNSPLFTTITNSSGNLYDTGGAGGNYQDDEREFWLIQPSNVLDITLDFSVFDIESGYDNLFVYDGDSTDAPLIGSYTGTTSPGIVTSSGSSLLLEFRSDCGVSSTGWEISYSSTPSNLGIESASNAFSIYPNPASSHISLLNGPVQFNATLMTIDGRICGNYTNLSGQELIEISGISNGTYHLIIDSGVSIITKRLVVKQ